MNTFLTATEAAAELGVNVATLYAYVSRGMIRAESQPGSRRKRYSAEDVRALCHRHSAAVAPAAPSGQEIVATAMTLLHDNRLYYRGHDMETLARQARLEAVASLLWQSEGEDPFEAACAFQPHRHMLGDCGVIGRQIAGLACAADADLAAFTRTKDGFARTGARVVRQLVMSTVGINACHKDIHRALSEGWKAPEAADFIRTALVAVADHELAPSTLAVRAAASTGATPWRAVTAGLCALDGPRHGRSVQRVARFLPVMLASADLAQSIAEHLSHGESMPGFGHRVYTRDDPRHRALMAALQRAGKLSEVARASAITDQVLELTGLHPNLDFALAFGCQALGLPHEAPLALFAIGRSVGWVGHAIEQAQSDEVMRFRARYTGSLP